MESGSAGEALDSGWEAITHDEHIDALYALSSQDQTIDDLDMQQKITLGHALQKLATLLLDQQQVKPDEETEQHGYQPFVEESTYTATPKGENESKSGPQNESDDPAAQAANIAAATAAAAASAQRALTASRAHLSACTSAITTASEESRGLGRRATAAMNRIHILQDQLVEIRKEVDLLREEEHDLEAMSERRRRVRSVEDMNISRVREQIAAEREDAQQVLKSQMERASAARVTLRSLADASADSTASTAMAAALAQVSEATTTLARNQLEEAAREQARRSRLDVQHRAAARNAELAHLDHEAGVAALEALRFRLNGQLSQMQLVEQQLLEARALYNVEKQAEHLAHSREKTLSSELKNAEEEFERERLAAIRMMERAQSAAAASLNTMCDVPNNHPLTCAGNSVGGPALYAAMQDAEKWRRRAEELELLQDIVVVDMNEADTCQHIGEIEKSSVQPLVELRRAMLALRSLQSKLIGVAAVTSEQSLSITAGTAAFVGGGLGLAALGPVCGTALASAAAGAAYAARRWTPEDAKEIGASDSLGGEVRVDNSEEQEKSVGVRLVIIPVGNDSVSLTLRSL